MFCRSILKLLSLPSINVIFFTCQRKATTQSSICDLTYLLTNILKFTLNYTKPSAATSSFVVVVVVVDYYSHKRSCVKYNIRWADMLHDIESY